ncbi:serine threonine kinase [Fusarium mexicanum]|uniref:Serine threonine kinase n=1 Tax=Fusarium mexicanum TaxID=751941 RepID=A0A8H5MW51_9HYPO|nr:serine threonine kinase [Fusarium mexicanum]
MDTGLEIDKGWRCDIALWQVHDTENDCDLVIRSNSGYVFYCHICPSQFVQSPSVASQYFKCLQLLRTGEVEIDDFYEEDAFEWLLGCFEPLITNLASSSDLAAVAEPTLAHYFFPNQTFVCSLTAVDDILAPQETDTKNHGWSSPIVKFDDDFVEDLNTWTECYTPSQIPAPPEAHICRLIGVVQQGDGLLGMLFAWIPNKGVLSKVRAAASPPELRRRWASQIQRSVDYLHKKGITWGDAKAENVLIDQDDDAWVIDFGGGYTAGWVDEDKTGTLEGDRQGLAKILRMLV